MPALNRTLLIRALRHANAIEEIGALDNSAALLMEYRAAVDALQRAMAEAADPGLSAMDRLEQVRALRPLWARHDELRQKIEATYR